MWPSSVDEDGCWWSALKSILPIKTIAMKKCNYQMIDNTLMPLYTLI